MTEKFSLIVALLFAMTSVVSAAAVSEDTLHSLAICFLVLCIIILIIAIILPIVLYRRRIQQERKGYTGYSRGSMYNLNARQRNISEREKEPNFYGIYHDPQPANSIYLPLEKKIEENGNYAHLEGSKINEDPHTYEELKKKGTYGGATYDNPVATAGDDDDDDDHDYEVADATIVRPKSRDYDNPHAPKADTAF